MKEKQLVFLKLGGSLITDKAQPLTPRLEIIHRIAEEIALTVSENPNIQILMGHGSGSFGHAIASQYETQLGGQGEVYWRGFAEVWYAARELNQILVRTLSEAGLPVIAFPPSAGVIARDHQLDLWDIRPMQMALNHGLIPVVAGDVIFDEAIGGTIFSTEEIFQYLAIKLRPDRILLAGLDQGVYQDPDQPNEIIPQVTPEDFVTILPALSGAREADVTGGMLAKVQLMISLVKKLPSLKVNIFSGMEPGNIQKALGGEPLGTLITNKTGTSVQ